MADTAATPPSRIQRVVRPFQEFFAREASSGIVLIIVTFAALVVANTSLADSYNAWLQRSAGVFVGSWKESNTVLSWINDGLMAVFFLVVGLEVKREFLTGELSSLKQAVLPLMAALGGMVVPATLFLSLNRDGFTQGWGIPMATDIAFALGVLALLGDRVPYGLRVFLAALAIVDDIGAVVVIAVFYSHGLDLAMLGGASICVLALISANALAVRNLVVYLIGGAILWWFLHHSGLHATLAGVITALTVPARARITGRAFYDRSQALVEEFETADETPGPLSEEHEAALHQLERGIERVTTPLQRLMHLAHPWVAFLILPVFAFANAGISLSAELLRDMATQPLPLGIALGLLVGKPVGIFGFAMLSVRLGLARLPEQVLPRHIAGVGVLGGIGFTMAIFISSLALADSNALAVSRIAILATSCIAGLLGYMILRRSQASGTPAT